MFTRGSFVFRLIGALLLVSLMIAGGVLAYRAGVSQGIAQAPEVAAAISSAAQNGQVPPAPAPAYGYGYGYPYWGYGFRPHFGFFPFGGIFGIILFFFLFFGLMRLLFFRRWGWHMYGRGPWRGYGHPWGPPPWAHEEKESDEEAPKENK